MEPDIDNLTVKNTSEESRKDEIESDMILTVAALSTSETVARYGSANSEYIKGYAGVDNEVGKVLSKGLKGISQEKTGVKQRAGWAAEVSGTSRNNAEAIINKSSERTYRSDDLKHYGIESESKYREAVDRVRLDKNGEIVYEAQTKLEASGNKVANQVSHDDHKYNKYFGKKLELPTEQVDDAKIYCRNRAEGLRNRAIKLEGEGKQELANKFRDRADRFDKLAKEDIVDLGIATDQAIDYAEQPLRETIRDIARTSHRAGVEGAKYGAVIGGCISLLTNGLNLVQEKKQFGEVAMNVATDTAKAATLGYSSAALGSALKGSMQQSTNQGIRNLARTNAPALAVTICISLGSSIKRFVSGEISEAQLLNEVGEKGAGILSSSMMAALGQLAIPIPFVGAAIGGMIGYTLSSFFYQSALDAARGVELSREQLVRIQAIEVAARGRIAEEQAVLDAFTRRELPQLCEETKSLFLAVSNGVHNIDEMAIAISEYATLMGKTLQFQTMTEFEEFMNSDKPLIL